MVTVEHFPQSTANAVECVKRLNGWGVKIQRITFVHDDAIFDLLDAPVLYRNLRPLMTRQTDHAVWFRSKLLGCTLCWYQSRERFEAAQQHKTPAAGRG